MTIPEFIKKRGRRLSLSWREKDSSKTGVIPLEEIKVTEVFLDADTSDAEDAVKYIYEYFGKKGKKVAVFSLSLGRGSEKKRIKGVTYIRKKDLSWCDCTKLGRIHPCTNIEEDLFISLLPEDSFPVEFVARCSSARFKIGRKQLSGNVYDLVFSGTEVEAFNQIQAFGNIMDFIERIQA